MTVRPLVLVAPSGTGKTTVAHALIRTFPQRFAFSVSATTREPREGEVEGEDYHFVSEAEFRRLAAAGELAEWAEVHGRLYGTPMKSLDPEASGGRTPILDIDVAGARQVRQRIPEAAVIFLLPPGPAEWLERLVGRGTEPPEEIRTRLETALGELEEASDFEEFVVNAVLGETVEEIVGLLDGEADAGVSSLRAESLCAALKSGARAWIHGMDSGLGTEDMES